MILLRHYIISQVNAWLLLLPAFIIIFVFSLLPITSTIINSFFINGDGGAVSKFVGIDNYLYLLEDKVFRKALWNNFIFVVSVIPFSIILALIMALWVNTKLVGRSLLRLAYFVPTILPMIAVANIWLFFFTPEYGLIEQIRSFFGFSGINWLGSESTALFCIIVVGIWKDAGFFMIFYLAALQHIPPSLGEAAILEGASRFYYLRKIVIPLLMPTTLFILINATINAFRMIDHLFILTKGGPNNASMLLLYYIYEVSFQFWDTGYGSVLTIALLMILGFIALFQFGILERKVHYQ